ncbi:MAG: putative globular PEP-CTERM protein [Opitutaceae bacterium]|jgi:putative globular PEP-CTERM protein (TIGR04254 family)|nr:putative globular PEP-CTERM protein [Opitutaceae bacterium]
MKKSLIMLGAAGLLSASLPAETFVVWDTISPEIRVYTPDGALVRGTDGYIATFWWGDQSAPSFMGAIDFADLLYGDYYAGQFYWASDPVRFPSTPRSDFYSEVRVWKVDALGANVTPEAMNAWLPSLDEAAALEVWANLLVTGADYGQWFTIATTDMNGNVANIINPSYYQKYGLIWTMTEGLAVPEPAAYAALVGLAILGVTVLRRRRRR